LIILGAPGTGKSTVANMFIEAETKFEVCPGPISKCRIANRLPCFLQDWIVTDCPGLFDVFHNNVEQVRAELLNSVFPMMIKLMFVITIPADRLTMDDIFVIKAVLKSIPSIGANYVVIVNYWQGADRVRFANLLHLHLQQPPSVHSPKHVQFLPKLESAPSPAIVQSLREVFFFCCKKTLSFLLGFRDGDTCFHRPCGTD
jgi:hypothetical protein